MSPMMILQVIAGIAAIIGFAFILVVPIFWPDAKLDPSLVQDVKDYMKTLVGFMLGGATTQFLNRAPKE